MVFLVRKRKSEYHHQVKHIQDNLVPTFILNKILAFLPKLPKKGISDPKLKKWTYPRIQHSRIRSQFHDKRQLWFYLLFIFVFKYALKGLKRSHLLSITPTFQNFPVTVKFTKNMELYIIRAQNYIV